MKIPRKTIFLMIKLIVLIAFTYYYVNTNTGSNHFYQTKLENGVVDSLYYNTESHNHPTIIVKDDEYKILEIPFNRYYKDMMLILKKGDTLVKHENSYDLYRISSLKVDTFQAW